MSRFCFVILLYCCLVFPQLAFSAWEMPPDIQQAQGIASVHMSASYAVDDFDGQQSGVISGIRWYGYYQDPADEPQELQREVTFEVSWHPNEVDQPYDHFGDSFFLYGSYPFIDEFFATESYYATSDNGTKIYQYTGQLNFPFDPQAYYSLNNNSYIYWVTLGYADYLQSSDTPWMAMASTDHWGQYAISNTGLHWWYGFESVSLSEYDLAITFLPEPATVTLLVLAGPLAALVSRKKRHTRRSMQ